MNSTRFLLAIRPAPATKAAVECVSRIIPLPSSQNRWMIAYLRYHCVPLRAKRLCERDVEGRRRDLPESESFRMLSQLDRPPSKRLLFLVTCLCVAQAHTIVPRKTALYTRADCKIRGRCTTMPGDNNHLRAHEFNLTTRKKPSRSSYSRVPLSFQGYGVDPDYWATLRPNVCAPSRKLPDLPPV